MTQSTFFRLQVFTPLFLRQARLTASNQPGHTPATLGGRRWRGRDRGEGGARGGGAADPALDLFTAFPSMGVTFVWLLLQFLAG